MDRISKEDRLELGMWQARTEAAQVRLEAVQAQYNAVAQRVTGAYGITPADRINLETGEITRVPKPVDLKPADPSLYVEPKPAEPAPVTPVA